MANLIVIGRYTDPSAILLNYHIPLDLFLPPSESEAFDKLAIIAAKNDAITPTTCAFFLRVSPVALNLLSKAILAPHRDRTRDWGIDISSTSLQSILELGEHRENVIYQPSHWYADTVTEKGT